jgi:hypothetical protein
MARVAGVEAKDACHFARIAYRFTKRKFGRVMETVKITAHSPRLLRGVGQYRVDAL